MPSSGLQIMVCKPTLTSSISCCFLPGLQRSKSCEYVTTRLSCLRLRWRSWVWHKWKKFIPTKRWYKHHNCCWKILIIEYAPHRRGGGVQAARLSSSESPLVASCRYGTFRLVAITETTTLWPSHLYQLSYSLQPIWRFVIHSWFPNYECDLTEW